MFVCNKCHQVIGPRIPAIRVVTKVREVEYPRREYLLHGEKVYDGGGRGTQIVSEEIVCQECAKETA
jgi:hypothetical protein